ncbi:MAG: YabP/YqfC family sporulation protein [Firmicutes bacterium]|nr:YabP/YqfC family sporulation protein [Bacillota bacterium]
MPVPNIKEKMANTLSLPKEIALDFPVITATGRGEVTVENYKSLLEFTDVKIRIRTKEGTITVEGERLALKHVTSENLLVVGRVAGILFD